MDDAWHGDGRPAEKLEAGSCVRLLDGRPVRRGVLCGVVAALTAGVILAACGQGESPDPPRTLDEVVTRADCTDVEELDELIAPIRGRAATAGIECTSDGARFHVFQRAPEGDPSDPTPASREGGSLENIRRLLGVESSSGGCTAYLAVTDDIFVLAETDAQLENFAGRVDISYDPPATPATPPASYSVCGLG